MNTLEERVALITGAGGGIGSATARTLAARGGWHVLIHDLFESSLKPLADDLGGAATPLAADLSDMAATAALWREAWTVKGKIDVLVNNAGLYPPAPLEDSLTDWIAVWNKSLDVHLKAPAVLCREAVNAFAGQPDGGIIIN